MQACVDWVLIIFGTQVVQKKRPVWPVFPDYLSISYHYVETRHFLFDLVLLMFTSTSYAYIIILIILLRPLFAHAFIENSRFNKDGHKNKREYINKPERNTYPFINNGYIWVQ